MRTTPTILLALLLASSTVSLLAQSARAEENPLEPSPHASPEAAVRDASRRLGDPTADAARPVDADVVGALTRLPDGRLGFMPLLQHHMAVEHWFVEGLAETALERLPAKGDRVFVRLRGEQTLLGVYGGGPLDWYGTGLKHGVEWGPVMGYHERIYRFRVKEIVWVRSRAQLLEARQRQATLMQRLTAKLRAQAYEEALTLVEEAIEGHDDCGLETRGLDKMQDYARRMIVLTGDPDSWNAADLGVVAEGLVFEPFQPFRELGPNAKKTLLQLLSTWPEAVRTALGPLAVDAWMGLEYRHQRDKARDVVEALEVPATEAWKERLAEADRVVVRAKERLDALREARDYAGMLALLEQVAPHQALVLDYALGADRTKFWVPAARRLAALEAAFDDPAVRRDLLLEQVRETIASRSGLPNSNQRPRYNDELLVRFLPRLTEEERREVETALLAIAKPLRARDHWQEILLVGELLSGFGADRARAFFPELLRRTSRSPTWQREHLRSYAERLGVR